MTNFHVGIRLIACLDALQPIRQMRCGRPPRSFPLLLYRGARSIFDEIAWSSPSVWQQTVDRLDALSMTYRSLPKWYDVDDLADLHRLSDDLSRGTDTHPALKALRDGAECALRARALSPIAPAVF